MAGLVEVDELLIKVGLLLAEDQDIKTWTNSTYGKDHIVYVGSNFESPPSMADAPFILIYGVYRRLPPEARVYYTLEYSVYVKQGATDSPVPNLQVLRGMKEAEYFRKLAEKVLLGKQEGLGSIKAVGETDMDNRYPLFRADSSMTFGFVNTRR